MKYDILIRELKEVETILTKSKVEKYSKPIDLNQDDWFQVAQQQSTNFYEENRSILESISKSFIDFFPKYDISQQKEILLALRSTENLRNNLSTNIHEENSKEWFDERVLMFILRDLGNDTRDEMMEMNALYKSSKEQNIDLLAIIKSKIEFANDEDWHGMGSAKSILQKTIAS
ncbi:MAG: hypothetical protein HRT58_22695 [Crocinitomicaceae bacterium]|nr:hypothetical protein [Flavobacteriales bacterium]NQZ38488.1 hypothetical protein [Crocinitomicaceae bacterium]